MASLKVNLSRFIDKRFLIDSDDDILISIDIRIQKPLIRTIDME